jgi:SagB-type dehydrogenase family enzyme
MAIKLPPPLPKGKKTLPELLNTRRSRRDFSTKALSLKEVGQILWSAQGLAKGPEGQTRTAPSAGATYPLEVFLVAGDEGVESIDAGVYRYNWKRHELELETPGDVRRDLAEAALGQYFLVQAPASVVVAADYSRTTSRYGERGRRYVHNEVGHLSQNIYLVCEDLSLATVEVGAFYDEEVKKVLGFAGSLEPLAIMPVGEEEKF